MILLKGSKPWLFREIMFLIVPMLLLAIGLKILFICTEKTVENYKKYNICVKISSENECKRLYLRDKWDEELRVLDLVKKDLKESR